MDMETEEIPEEIYSREELRRIWWRFRNKPDAPQLLADFALCSEAEARMLIWEFMTEGRGHGF